MTCFGYQLSLSFNVYNGFAIVVVGGSYAAGAFSL